MHPLVMLYRLQGRALYRRMTRNMRSLKGVLLGGFGVAVIALWLAPSLWQAYRMPRTDPAQVRAVAPVIMLAMSLLALVTSGGEKAVAFTPAEVDFLFPGPFTRRALLAYKIGKALAGLLFSSVLMSVVFLRHAPRWPQAWAGLFLAMLFMHLLSMSITLVAQSAGERAYTRTRKIVLGAILLAVGAAVWPALMKGGRPGFFEVARMLRESRLGAVVLAPLEVFGRLFTAHGWGEALGYAALAAGVNAVLLFVVFYLDADYLEAAAAKSQAVYARLQRVRKGGLSAIGGPMKKARESVPELPYLMGAGPIAWRQMTAAVRNSKGLLFVMLILAMSVGPLLFSTKPGNSLTGAVVGSMLWITFIVGAWLRFDFRGDLDQIDHLKSLPVSGAAVSVGQLVTPTLLMSLCHLAIVGSVLGVMRRADPVLLTAAVLCVPFNALLFGVENFIFLLFPTRAAATPGDFQGYGRQILVFFAKGALLLVVGGVVGLAGFIVFKVSGSLVGAVGVAAGLLSGAAVAMVPAVAWAYGRFDVAGDVPA
ncbi:MAG: putative rane protein [Phycisphaerales bacterium]|nr:putative rane protein [Phycisphaerales bacterium]